MISKDDPLVTDLGARVGGYLTNTRHGATYCSVCFTPTAGYSICVPCNDHCATPSAQLANLVVPLTYGGHTPQSRTLLYGYKKAILSIGSDKDAHTQEQVLMLYLIFVALGLHRSCIEKVAGALTHYAVVPSTSGRTHHPLTPLSHLVCSEVERLHCIAVDYVGPRGVRQRNPDWYQIPDGSNISGSHVLVVDDTWVSGGRAQSVAGALKREGATSVTVLVVAKWLQSTWGPNSNFFDSSKLQVPYDPRICPVTGSSCPP